MTPANSPDAERAAIGAVLVNADAYYEMRDCGLTSSHFYNRKWAAAWGAIAALADIGQTIDPISVAGQVHDDSLLSVADLLACMSEVPSSLNGPAYAAVVMADAARRAIVGVASSLVRRAHNGVGPAQAAADAARELDAIAQSALPARIATAADAAQEFYEVMDEWVTSRKIPGLPWPFKSMNWLGGRRRKELMVMAGRPGMGKSSLAGQMSYMDARAGLRVSVCSLEMSKSAWMEQAILADLAIRKTTAGPAELGRIRERALEAQDLPMRFYERGYCTADELELHIKLHARDLGGLDVVYIDHLGYIDHGARKAGNIAYAIGVTTKRLARIAKELDCVVIVLSQLNRASETAQREPTLIDLRDSGEIEQDARLVMFLHRPEYRNTDRTPEQNMMPELCKLIVAKNNNGPTITLHLAYTRALRRFSEYEQKSEQPAYAKAGIGVHHQKRAPAGAGESAIDADDLPY